MTTRFDTTRASLLAAALTGTLLMPAAFAQLPTEYQPPSPNDGTSFRAVQTKPSANNDAYTLLKTRCETEVNSGKSSGDVCAEAAAILLGSDPPDHLRELASVTKSKIALRLLERGVDTSNLAAARAYDMYNKTDIGGFLTGSVADSYRAAELMDLMVKRNYVGAELRKARAAVSLFSIGTTEAEKRQHCDTTRKLIAGGKLDADSKLVANDVLDSTVCKNMAAEARQQQPQ
jgi:hypothetical protein